MSSNDKKVRILCVEDEPQMRSFLLVQLKARGFHAQVVGDGEQAIDLAAIFQPQLVLLDLTLPSLEGLIFLRRLREWSTIPVIILSTHNTESIKIKALDQGADDYLTKPFSLDELLARIRVALRRSNMTPHVQMNGTGRDKPQYRNGGENGLVVDYARRVVQSDGKSVHLTPKEYELLCELTRNAGKVLTHRELLQRIWGPEYSGEKTYLRTIIRHLRLKLERDPAQPHFLRSVLGVGYFAPEPDENEVEQ